MLSSCLRNQMRRSCVCTWYVLGVWAAIVSLASAQTNDNALADEYYARQEYDKAREVYEKIIGRSGRSLNMVYANYFKTLLQLKDFVAAERTVKRIAKDYPQIPNYRIDYGAVLELLQQPDKADREWAAVIEEHKKNPDAIAQAAEHFIRWQKPEWAEKALLAGRKFNKEKNAFALELAEVYANLGKSEAMLTEYLNYATTSPNHLEPVKSALQDRLTKPEELERLEKVLLAQTQREPDEITYNELLLWLYLQQKRFTRVFVQARALDKRYQLEGTEMLNLGSVALKNQDYEAAKQFFGYVVQTYPSGGNYPQARNMYLKAREEAVKNTYPVQITEIKQLINDYEKLISELGNNYKTLEASRNMALLYAFYLKDYDRALHILNKALENAAGRTDFVAQAKTDQGDIYLLKDEPWESTLLYSQVEKLRKEHTQGHEAKLRNAKLSFYQGEFALAQEHLDILKEATSREIANDALALSLLIMDNTFMDTLGLALREYAKVDLLLFQNRYEDALTGLDSLLARYKRHSLTDEALYAKAQILLKLGKPKESVTILEEIVKTYGEDILGDDAMFLLAKTYEEALGDKPKAQTLYEQFLDKYPASIYVAESRKRFRILRGDFVN